MSSPRLRTKQVDTIYYQETVEVEQKDEKWLCSGYVSPVRTRVNLGPCDQNSR